MTFPTRFGANATGAHPDKTQPPGKPQEAQATTKDDAAKKQAQVDASKASALQGDKT
ncbi:hypothetical protein ACFZAI_14105 [Achromobacter sp. NPDC008082]|uniref:hypothetical protein n=1 Tax=Achromobacter sp. NPDC008082 TaxID=3363888 RepID=UPI0036E095AE